MKQINVKPINVPCQDCGALPGQKCRTTDKGRLKKKPHISRVMDARREEAYRELIAKDPKLRRKVEREMLIDEADTAAIAAEMKEAKR